MLELHDQINCFHPSNEPKNSRLQREKKIYIYAIGFSSFLLYICNIPQYFLFFILLNFFSLSILSIRSSFQSLSNIYFFLYNKRRRRKKMLQLFLLPKERKKGRNIKSETRRRKSNLMMIFDVYVSHSMCTWQINIAEMIFNQFQ